MNTEDKMVFLTKEISKATFEIINDSIYMFREDGSVNVCDIVTCVSASFFHSINYILRFIQEKCDVSYKDIESIASDVFKNYEQTILDGLKRDN